LRAQHWLLLFIPFLAAAQTPIPQGARLDTIATGFLFVEGPVWSDSLGLLFSDVWTSTIYRWTPQSGATVYLHPSDSSNGLTFDLQGRLVLTQMQDRRVSRQEKNGTITPLASTYNGKRFNSPNDIVVRSDGSIFFTDPDFNIPRGEHAELSFKGIYRIDPAGGLHLLDSTFELPNGICFSPDENTLYVDDSNQCKIYAWDVLNDSTIANKRLFYTIPAVGYADGMKTDAAGNVFCAGPTGVWIISPSGAYLDKIVTPQNPSNCAWGDSGRTSLYITAGAGVYRMRFAVTGVEEHGALPARGFELFGNYPNPFNPTTTIGYRIGGSTRAPRTTSVHVNLAVVDVLGRVVATLVDGYQRPGRYAYQFPPSDISLASGTYFCRLTADGSFQTSAMVLLK
jgi:gluconolactonase